MKKSELALSAAVGLAAGAFGGAAGVAIASWLAEAPKLLGGPWWDVVTAFGTIGSAAGAVAISFWAQQHSKKMELESSKRYALGSVDTMISACNDIQWALVLKKAASNYLDPVFERLPNEAYERIERAWIRLSSLDFERLSLAMPEQAGAFVKLKVNFRHEIDLLPRSKEDPYPLNDMVLNDIQADLKRMWDSILSSCQR